MVTEDCEIFDTCKTPQKQPFNIVTGEIETATIKVNKDNHTMFLKDYLDHKLDELRIMGYYVKKITRDTRRDDLNDWYTVDILKMPNTIWELN